MELAVENISKKFKDKTAVDKVSISLCNGVWGLLGANGAGKTTLMRMVAGILTPSSGRVTLDGVDIRLLGERYRNIFGYLPQNFGFYPEFTVLDYLHYMAALKGLDKHIAQKRINELLEMVGLSGVKRKLVRKLSGGMQRRVGIIQALLNNPEILILDEPTSGLDPAERVHFRNILSELGQERVVLISTHIVSDVEYIASKNALMKNGKLIALDTTEELVKRVQGVVWECLIHAEQLYAIEKNIPIVSVRNERENMVSVRYLSEEAQIQNSIGVAPRLEDLYLWEFRDAVNKKGWKN